MARSLHELARRAMLLYTGGGSVSEAAYLIRLEEAWRAFVHEAGGVYTRTTIHPLTIGQRTFAVPELLRELHPQGVYLFYTPRAIVSIARADGVVTVETDTEHGLTAGMSIRIDDVEATTTFDGAFVIVSAPTDTTFTYAQDDDDDAGTGGQVLCAYNPWYLEPILHLEDSHPSVQSTTGVPRRYFYTNDSTLVLDPASDGGFPELFIVYDAEAPADIDFDEVLPVPGYVEAGLIDYAAAFAGVIPQEQGLLRFQQALATWREGRNLRQNLARIDEDNW
jgi:hypothetical protein